VGCLSFLSSGSSDLAAKRRAGAVLDADSGRHLSDLSGRRFAVEYEGNRASGEEPEDWG
jgi:hypothetical protein